MNKKVAFLPYHTPDQIIAWRGGAPISAGQFNTDSHALAARLPDGGPMLNGCIDRYWFAVGLAAAMLRRHLSILPHNQMPATLDMLRAEFPALYCLSETGAQLMGLPGISLDASHASISAESPPLSFDADLPCACLFTSGSTGRPVAYTRSWGVVMQSARSAAMRLGLTHQQAMHIVATVPVQHSYGFESSLTLAMVSGGSFTAERPFYPADVARALAVAPRPRMLVTTPVHLRAINGLAMPIPPVDLLLSATAMLDIELARKAERQFNAPLFEIYGATESGQSASRRPLADLHWQPLPGLVFSIADGVASVRGGHIGLPVALGDILEIGADGRFLLRGRIADMVNVAGKRSSIAHLEGELLAIPGIEDGAFLVVDPENDLQRLAAFYVSSTCSRDQVIAALRARIEPAFMPRPLIHLDAMPRNTTGKVTRQSLLRLLKTHDARPTQESS